MLYFIFFQSIQEIYFGFVLIFDTHIFRCLSGIRPKYFVLLNNISFLPINAKVHAFGSFGKALSGILLADSAVFYLHVDVFYP